MVSLLPTQFDQDFHYNFSYLDPIELSLPGLDSPPPQPMPTSSAETISTAATTIMDDRLNKKVRKPYTIKKSRQSWTDQEHEKFLEAVQLFDRDWKKIEAFVGSKTVIQIRSHAQKYFLKVQKNGTSEHVPPPRPKRKATHPYPQKASKNAAMVSQDTRPVQASAALLETGYNYGLESSSVHKNTISAALPPWNYDAVQAANVLHVTKDDVGLAAPAMGYNCCDSSSNDSTPRTWSTFAGNNQAMPDFAQVYSFIGSVFDPSESDHIQKLKQMDPINVETILLLMTNLSINLTSPEFEDHRRLLLWYDDDSEKAASNSLYCNCHADNASLCTAIPSV